MPCDSCATGEKSCGLGHLGDGIVNEAKGGYGGFFYGPEKHRYAINKLFRDDMENNCDNAGGAKYIVDPEDNDCTHFVNCHKQMVFKCEPGWAFDSEEGGCDDVHARSKDKKPIMCQGKELDSSIYHPEFYK